MSSKSKQPIELLKSGQLLAVTNSPDCGIILQKPYFAEFVGPGAAIGGMFDVECVSIHPIGTTEFTVPDSIEERQQAFRRRIDNIEKMQVLCQSDVPLGRAIALLDLLCQRFGVEEIRHIPNDVLGKVVGVLPGTVVMAWQKQFNLRSPADAEDPNASELVAVAL